MTPIEELQRNLEVQERSLRVHQHGHDQLLKKVYGSGKEIEWIEGIIGNLKQEIAALQKSISSSVRFVEIDNSCGCQNPCVAIHIAKGGTFKYCLNCGVEVPMVLEDESTEVVK